jgi:hypothetical protein
MATILGWVFVILGLTAGAVQMRIRRSLRMDRRFRAPRKSDLDMLWLQWEEDSYTPHGQRLMNIAFVLLLLSAITFPLGLGLLLYAAWA